VYAGFSKSKHHNVSVELSQNDPEVLLRVQRMLGFGRMLRHSNGHTWVWRCTRQAEISAFIDLILPYSVVKRGQLEIMRELLELPRSERGGLVQELREAKQVWRRLLA
jgi:hypothetical protein